VIPRDLRGIYWSRGLGSVFKKELDRVVVDVGVVLDVAWTLTATATWT
jgi:hypothetical protein